MNKVLYILALMLILCVPADSLARSSKSKKKSRQPAVTSYGWRKTVTSDNQIELYPDKPLNKIANYTSVTVKYVVSSVPSITIKGPKDKIGNVSITNSNRAVSIASKNDKNTDFSGVTVRVASPAVGNLSVFGSGDISAEEINCSSAVLQSFGSGDITVGSLDCTGLKINLYGSGDIRANRLDATSVQAVSQSSGDLSVGSADVTTLSLTLQGSGNILFKKVDGTGLRAINQGAGNIEVSGNFTSASLLLYGSGDIIARGVKAPRITKENLGSGSIRD